MATKDKRTNVEVVKERITSLGIEIGNIDSDLNKLTAKSMKAVVDAIEYCETVFTTCRRVLHVIEISECDDEIDVTVYTAEEYFAKYGTLDESYDNDDITEAQYNRLKKLGL